MGGDDKPQQEPDKQPPPDRDWVTTDIIHKEDQSPADYRGDDDD